MCMATTVVTFVYYRELNKGIGRFRELLRVIESRSTQSLRQVTLQCDIVIFVCYAPPLIGGGIKRCFCLMSVCLSIAYVRPKSRTERPRKTKIGTEVAHITRDSDTTFKVRRSRSPGRYTTDANRFFYR